LDINDFRTFLEVSRIRHFGQAARNLCITQSAVSARIRQLEEALGKQLFIRERNNIQLTPAGEQLLSYAEIITTAWSGARQTIGLSETDSISLLVGGLPGLWDILLQEWLHAVYAKNDKMTVHAEIHGTEILHRRIMNGTLDLAFVYEAPVNDTLEIKAIADIPLKMVSSTEHMSAVEATADNYVMVDWGTTFLNEHARHFPDMPAPLLHTDLGRIAFNFIADHGGSAYLAEPMCSGFIAQGKLHLVEDAPAFQRTAYAIYHTGNDKKAFILKQLEAVKADRPAGIDRGSHNRIPE
jgi:DNA-binding transcriptional LysR family regulator